jgi:SAM-dependent methyltransferase
LLTGRGYPLATEYTDAYFARLTGTSLRAARAIVPAVVDALRPASVVDVGCGVGAWLSVFREHGVDDVFGVDGDYVPPEALLIPAESFASQDLSDAFSLDRTFDLAVSLEVAEHLPARSADRFVASLCALAPLVLFSAAIPGQGGRSHVNEQWQSYWSSRFEQHGYAPVDLVRPEVWTKQEVAWWYVQNTLLYVREDAWSAHPALAEQRGRALMLDVVHPRLYLEGRTTPELAAQLRRAVVHSIKLRLGRRR